LYGSKLSRTDILKNYVKAFARYLDRAERIAQAQQAGLFKEFGLIQ
jgi:hypothetical protein